MCVWVFAQTYTHIHSSYLLGAGFFFPPLGGNLPVYHWDIEADSGSVKFAATSAPFLPCLMHKYHHATGRKIPAGKNLESAYYLLNLNLNLYGGVAPIWPQIKIPAEVTSFGTSSAKAVYQRDRWSTSTNLVGIDILVTFPNIWIKSPLKCFRWGLFKFKSFQLRKMPPELRRHQNCSRQTMQGTEVTEGIKLQFIILQTFACFLRVRRENQYQSCACLLNKELESGHS